MSELLHVQVSGLAAEQIRVAEAWWRTNRPKAPNAIREELERASALVATQPELGSRARNVTLAGVRRIHLARIRYHLYYRVGEAPRQIEIWASGTQAAEADRRFEGRPTCDGADGAWTSVRRGSSLTLGRLRRTNPLIRLDVVRLEMNRRDNA